MREDLRAILDDRRQHRILVVGDLMLDRYVWGEAERISPEAPIQVLRVEREEERLGGAGSVVRNLAQLGCQVELAAVVGEDLAAGALGQLLEQTGVEPGTLTVAQGRPTTVKERQLARGQQVLRVDREDRTALPPGVQARLLERVEAALPHVQAVVLSDYGKGVLSDQVLTRVLARAEAPVLVDPRRADYAAYRGAALVTPNRAEASAASGLPVTSVEAAGEAARLLVRRHGLGAVAVTLDRDGLVLVAAPEESPTHLPTRPREVIDVTGAGDMVISVFALSLAGGHDLLAAGALANLAGGLVVSRVGVVPLSRVELLEAAAHEVGAHRRKIVSREHLALIRQAYRQRGQQVVLTNGCFDLLHAGHVEFLRRARREGDVLVVAINSDTSVRRIKGMPRPFLPQAERAELLAALEDVDYVVVFEEDDPAQLVGEVLPDVLVKGSDWATLGVVGRETVEASGGRVVLVDLVEGYSTSSLAERIRQALENPEEAS